MKTKTKIAIFVVAVFLSLFGFNLITCSDCVMDLLAGKDAGCTVTTKVISIQPDLAAM